MADRSSAEIFSETAEDYAATMVPTLRPVAAEVVRRASLLPGQMVLDVGTGTGIGAAAALGEGRQVTGVDRAAGILAIARREVPAAIFLDADFERLPFADAAFDAVIAVHALLYATDPVAALAEWRRVTRPGGRLSLSVPGPIERTPTAVFGPVYERFGVNTSKRYLTTQQLADALARAGWSEIGLDADPSVEIVLPDDAALARWRRVGSRGAATADWPEERHAALSREMLAAVPRDPDGRLHIPFGVLYLAARHLT